LRERQKGAWEVRRRGLAAEAESEGELVLEELSPAALRARWTAAARLHEHAVPVAVPARLTLGRPARASFTLPASAIPLAGTLTPQALGRLLGRVHDRGLDLPALGPREIAGATPAGLVLRPPAELLDFDPRPGSSTSARRFRAVGAALAAEPAFLAGYLAAFARQPAERAALARALEVADQ
jgi:hypothetical protein